MGPAGRPAREASSGGGVLGVDPGLRITGYGVLDRQRSLGSELHEAGVVRGGNGSAIAPRSPGASTRAFAKSCSSYNPPVLALEELYSHYAHPRTAILMGHARGVICLAAAESGIPVIGYSATQVKKILTGSGRAPKAQVQQAVQRELRLSGIPDPPDVADALAVAMCHFYLAEEP